MNNNVSRISSINSIKSPKGDITGIGEDLYQLRQVKKINLEFLLISLRKYWYVSFLLSTLMMAGIYYKTWKEPRIYRSDIQIEIELQENSSMAEKLALSTGDTSADSRATTIETILQILKSEKILQQAIDGIPNQELKPSVDEVSGNLRIVSGQNSNILSISYTDTLPERAVATLTALSNTYIDYSIKTKKVRTDNSINFIESQLPESRKRLELSSRQLEEFRRQYGFVDPENSGQSLTAYRQQIIDKLDEMKVRRLQTQQQYEELKKNLTEVGLQSDNVLSTTMLTQDAAYQELFKKLNELELSYSQETVRFNDNNPISIGLKEKRDQVLSLLRNRAQQVLKRNVLDKELTNGGIANFSNNLAQNLANKQAEIVTSLASQESEEQGLRKIYERVESQIAQLPNLQKQYTELQRQYTIYSQEMTAFLQKLQGLKITGAERVIPWNLLDPPKLPQEPISPNVPQRLGLGALGSLLVGLLAAVGLNQFDDRVDDPDTVKSTLGIPLLALIPTVNSFAHIQTKGSTVLQTTKNDSNNYSSWNFVEAIRTLALGIGLTTDGEENQMGKVVAFTSSLPKEGKSTITFHTGVTLAELGYRVLLVDADLYRSSLSSLCQGSELFQSVDFANEAGLSDALLKVDKWEDLIKKCPQIKLDVLLSGHQPVNSIALLNSPHFPRLIEQWKKKYDYVIFDTPPVVGVSDTHLITTLVDGLIYIVSLDVAQWQAVKRTMEIIAPIQTPILGLVINRVKSTHSNKYHPYYRSRPAVFSRRQ